MFYISRNIETEVFFPHNDMDLTGDDLEILRRLREKVEGFCDQEYGFLIQVIANQSSSELGMAIDRVDIRRDGLYIRTKFTCITFRPSKNEIMPIIVTEITESGIMGRAGPAHIMIPQLKISSQNARYRPKENIFELFSQDSDETLIIRVGSKLYCRCFEMRVEMNSIMRIIGSLEHDLIQLAIQQSLQS